MQNSKLTIGIVGAGVMGNIFVDRLIETKTLYKNQILISRRYDDKKQLIDRCQILILAVKPQDFGCMADQLTKAGVKPETLIISIMAGVDIKRIQRFLGVKSVIRSMPNLPAKIGQGVTVWKASVQVSQEQKSQIRKILQSLGTEIEVKSEKMIDLATAVSGSGHAYVFLFQELMIDAAQKLGLSKKLSARLVSETILGAVNLQQKLRVDPKVLREQVTSKAGTTAAALDVFTKHHLPAIFNKALQSAFNRSQELRKSL